LFAETIGPSRSEGHFAQSVCRGLIKWAAIALNPPHENRPSTLDHEANVRWVERVGPDSDDRGAYGTPRS
jgi:hypothetical protein